MGESPSDSKRASFLEKRGGGFSSSSLVNLSKWCESDANLTISPGSPKQGGEFRARVELKCRGTWGFFVVVAFVLFCFCFFPKESLASVCLLTRSTVFLAPSPVWSQGAEFWSCYPSILQGAVLTSSRASSTQVTLESPVKQLIWNTRVWVPGLSFSSWVFSSHF